MAPEWLIEIGHSRLKLATYASGNISQVTAMSITRFDEWLNAASTLEPRIMPAHAWLCAVPEDHIIQPVESALRNAGIKTCRVVTGAVELPVRLAYAGLGVDRWLALQAVWKKTQSAFVLVDCGTATTIDTVDASGVHQGGWILPGREACRRGLIASAPGLLRGEVVIDEPDFDQPACDTFAAIERGLLLQQIGAVELALLALQQDGQQPVQVILTGGDTELVRAGMKSALIIRARVLQNTSELSASTLESQLKPIMTSPDVVLEGLAMAVEQLR